MAGDLLEGGGTLGTVKERKKRPTWGVESPDSSDSFSAEAGPFQPHDRRPDQRASEIWAYRATTYVKYCRLSDGQVTRVFSSLCHRKGTIVFYDVLYSQPLPITKS